MRIALLAACALACAIVTTPAEARPAFHPDCNVTMPCEGAPKRSFKDTYTGKAGQGLTLAGTRKAKKQAAAEQRRAERGQYLEQRLPFGTQLAPDTQRGYLRRQTTVDIFSHAPAIVRGAAEILGGRPAGCPRRYCGCAISLKFFGRIIPTFNLAANYGLLPPTTAGPGVIAWRRGHVLAIEQHVGGNDYLVWDPNSGRGLTRRHVRNLAGYRFVQPVLNAQYAAAGER